MNLPEFLAEVRRRTKANVTTSQVCSYSYGAVSFFVGGKRSSGWVRTKLDDNGVLVVTGVVAYEDRRSGLLLRSVASVANIQIELTTEEYQKALANLPY